MPIKFKNGQCSIGHEQYMPLNYYSSFIPAIRLLMDIIYRGKTLRGEINEKSKKFICI